MPTKLQIVLFNESAKKLKKVVFTNQVTFGNSKRYKSQTNWPHYEKSICQLIFVSLWYLLGGAEILHGICISIWCWQTFVVILLEETYWRADFPDPLGNEKSEKKDKIVLNFSSNLKSYTYKNELGFSERKTSFFGKYYGVFHISKLVRKIFLNRHFLIWYSNIE